MRLIWRGQQHASNRSNEQSASGTNTTASSSSSSRFMHADEHLDCSHGETESLNQTPEICPHLLCHLYYTSLALLLCLIKTKDHRRMMCVHYYYYCIVSYCICIF